MELKNSNAAIEAYRKAIGMLMPTSPFHTLRKEEVASELLTRRHQQQRLSSVVWSWSDVRASRHASLRHRLLSAGDCPTVCLTHLPLCWSPFGNLLVFYPSILLPFRNAKWNANTADHMTAVCGQHWRQYTKLRATSTTLYKLTSALSKALIGPK